MLTDRDESDPQNEDSEFDSEFENSSQHSSESFCSRPNTTTFRYGASSVLKPTKSLNLLQKLYNREVRGNFGSPCRASDSRLFDNRIPADNVICLKEVLPDAAISDGHICVGLSKCGQFLLTYTHTSDWESSLMASVHSYRLYWWLFVPHRRARKVAEVALFDNQAVYCELSITVCQWPTDAAKLVVYGHCLYYQDCQFRHSHLTVTSVPSLNRCKDCKRVEASFEDDDSDLATLWDGCARFSCLKHGMTVHANFEIVSPYPRFDSQLSMKHDGVILFNTGNFLISFAAELEHCDSPQPTRPARNEEVPGRVASYLEQCEARRREEERRRISEEQEEDDERRRSKEPPGIADELWAAFVGDSLEEREREEVTAVGEEATLNGEDALWEAFVAADRRGKVEGESDLETCESKDSDLLSPPAKRSRVQDSARPSFMDSDQELSLSFTPQSRLSGSEEEGARKRGKSRRNRGCPVKLSSPAPYIPATPPATPFARKAAETVYEFTEDAAAEEKLSSFRRRRLADKRYEFSDSDSENILPYGVHRRTAAQDHAAARRRPATPGDAARRRCQQLGSPRSPGITLELATGEETVLRPLNSNVTGICLLSPREKPCLKKTQPSDCGTLKTVKEEFPAVCKEESVPAVSSKATRQFSNQFCRRYIQVDDELVSVLTDGDDEEVTGSPSYQFPLSVAVHGAGYAQLQRISNAKADKLMAPGVFVREVTFDLEAFCNDVSERLCDEAGLKFNYCPDYDVEIVDVCPLTGEVVLLAVMRILTQENTILAVAHHLLQREQFLAECMFLWNTATASHRILRSSGLTLTQPFEVTPAARGGVACWQPARGEVGALRDARAAFPLCRPVKAISDETAAFGDSFQSISDMEHLIELKL